MSVGAVGVGGLLRFDIRLVGVGASTTRNERKTKIEQTARNKAIRNIHLLLLYFLGSSRRRPLRCISVGRPPTRGVLRSSTERSDGGISGASNRGLIADKNKESPKSGSHLISNVLANNCYRDSADYLKNRHLHLELFLLIHGKHFYQ